MNLVNSPYQVTKDLEAALSTYTGAPFVVAVNSCTAALLLALKWDFLRVAYRSVKFPSRTYCSAPMSALHAGFKVMFEELYWTGSYRIWPTSVWDSARRFTSGMYIPGQFQCVSFSASKILGSEQGGAILCDDEEAYEWFKRMRFDGRTEGVDPLEEKFDVIGHHCLMIPSVAATLLVRLHHLPKVNADLPFYEYPDLSKHPAFK